MVSWLPCGKSRVWHALLQDRDRPVAEWEEELAGALPELVEQVVQELIHQDSKPWSGHKGAECLGFSSQPREVRELLPGYRGPTSGDAVVVGCVGAASSPSYGLHEWAWAF